MESATNLELENPLSSGSCAGDFFGFGTLTLNSIHPRGSVLYAEGQPSTGVYVLCSGHAKVSVSSSKGKTVIIRIARPLEFLGVNSVLKGTNYEATVETLERCRVGFISRADFMNHLDQHKSASIAVLRALSNELSEVVERARLVLLSGSAEERLAGLLLKWHEELGEATSSGTHLNHGLTQEEIGQMICVSRETVSRAFTEMKRKRVLEIIGSRILIKSRGALEAIAI